MVGIIEFSIFDKINRKVIDYFMNCNFFNYAPIITSQVSRRFVFKLPYPALGKDKTFETK